MMKEYSEELERINLMSKVEYAQEIEDVLVQTLGNSFQKRGSLHDRSPKDSHCST